MNQMQALLEKARNDKELMAKLDALGASGAGPDKIIALAAEYGFSITAEDYTNACESAMALKSGEISEVELDSVAGGDGATQNRWDPKVCNNYNRTHYNCVGFFKATWCDHYERTWHHQDNIGYTTFRHVCGMGRFDYIADQDGNIK